MICFPKKQQNNELLTNSTPQSLCSSQNSFSINLWGMQTVTVRRYNGLCAPLRWCKMLFSVSLLQSPKSNYTVSTPASSAAIALTPCIRDPAFPLAHSGLGGPSWRLALWQEGGWLEMFQPELDIQSVFTVVKGKSFGLCLCSVGPAC